MAMAASDHNSCPRVTFLPTNSPIPAPRIVLGASHNPHSSSRRLDVSFGAVWRRESDGFLYESDDAITATTTFTETTPTSNIAPQPRRRRRRLEGRV
jgi:hypothetical protein